MHIPDGFLDVKTTISFWGISAVFLSYSIKKLRDNLNEKIIPLMGVLGAFVFASQMLNFPILNGTSGHFVGGVLLGIVLGPFAGLITMSSILLIQSLLFADGGIISLGANIFNMGVVGPFLGFYLYKNFLKFFKNNFIISSFLSSFLSVVIGAAFCSIQLGISNTIPISLGLPTMVGIHALIGIGEGVITSLILSFLYKIRKDLIIPETLGGMK
ncbi:MAG: energy-coupling factor ABC transporter permease [Caldisericia bacterium]|jgi:cobalt/nickel transport system permease protein|nr:energy-coupling factor ABC transporter permease [Caldisericia bacterium]